MSRHPHRPLAAALAAALAATALLLGPVSPAYAHNVLRKATPAQDATLKKAPTRITLEFLQKLNPSFTTITLSDADKQQVTTGEPEVSGTKGTVTIEPPLANGVYTVAYRVVSRDGHPVQGSYTFTVADPTATAEPSPSPPTSEPAPTPSATPSAEPTASTSPVASDSSDGPGTTALLAGGGIVLALVAAAAVLLLRRRSAAGGDPAR
ncbi:MULTISPECIES: copper resistance CopC family protein [unclassified Micromonospora]|uniref:copper resistance CopC family protein n=1 Tax=unclassified Micromonospora TaxID=2617518 RepID=UPI0022B71843|nr:MULTISPECIES: copper resistance CopC family protein [unclassified Micromonospora]MCZ7421258.1 copper resistance protein CopC [Verrucosispora sp. WMMA2121]WBB94046.1 copper resistance protein CopC [Verrucosispora sp. WMMC514]